MNRYLVRVFLGFSMLVLSAQAQESIRQSDWMDLVVGFRDGATGAEVREVKRGEQAGERHVIIAMPKVEMDAQMMEEVLVLGHKPEEAGGPLLENFSFEWLDPLDDEHYGLLLRFTESGDWPIRLFLHTGPLPQDQP